MLMPIPQEATRSRDIRVEGPKKLEQARGFFPRVQRDFFF
jgi:hypothetical protein